MIDDKVSSLITQANPDELKKIKMFKCRAEKLLSNSLVQNKFNPSADLTINYKGSSSSYQLPSDEAFESLLMRFRHFWLQKEPCNFFNILGIVNRYVTDAHSHTQFLKESWTNGVFHSTNVIIFGSPLKAEKLIDVWLNAEFFHNDDNKKIELDNLTNEIDLISPGLAKYLLIGSICERCKVISELNKLLEKIE